MEKLKKCSKCGRELPVSEFWKNASTEDGLQTYCKECGNVYARNRKKTPGEPVRKPYKLYHLVILNGVKNLKISTLCLQILRFTQNDRTKGKQKIVFGQPGGGI